MGVYRFGGRDNFIVCGIQLAIADIVPDGACEQEIILGHDPHLTAQAFDGHFFYIKPVDTDDALLHVIKTADQIDNGGFARSRRPDQSDGLSGLYVKAHIV